MQHDLLVDSVSADWLARHRLPAAAREWPLRQVRNHFFSSPILPRLRDASSLRRTVAAGVRLGLFALAGRDASGAPTAVRFEEEIPQTDITFGEDDVLLTSEMARKMRGATATVGVTPGRDEAADGYGAGEARPPISLPPQAARFGSLTWRGELAPGKWALFYSRVLTKLVLGGGVRLGVELEARPEGGLTPTQVSDVRDGPPIWN